MDALMLRLAYSSRIDLPRGPGQRRAEIDRILATARRRNVRADITGALLATDSAFVQVLEGPRAAVEETFARIRADRRHNGIVLLSSQSMAKRGFSGWPMAFVDAGEMEDDAPLMMAEFGLFVALKMQVAAQERARKVA